MATAIVLGVVASVFALVWWSYEKNYLFLRDVVLGCFRRRFGSWESKKAETAAKLVLSGMAVLFSLLSLFGLAVAFGIIRSGEKFKPSVSEESQRLRQYLESSGGRSDVPKLSRKSRTS